MGFCSILSLFLVCFMIRGVFVHTSADVKQIVFGLLVPSFANKSVTLTNLSSFLVKSVKQYFSFVQFTTMRLWHIYLFILPKVFFCCCWLCIEVWIKSFLFLHHRTLFWQLFFSIFFKLLRNRTKAIYVQCVCGCHTLFLCVSQNDRPRKGLTTMHPHTHTVIFLFILAG